jgi:PAS domain S-box-containing protein
MQELENCNNGRTEAFSNTAPYHILQVDDEPCVLEVSKSILELENNFKVDNASTVDEAQKKLRQHQYDAVISDYEMPQKNGLQFLQELREKNNSVPFVIFTGKGREEIAVKALNLGADGYYNKQGSTETVYGELAHGIRHAIEKAKAKSALEESEKRYRTLMDQAAEAIFIHNIKGQIVDANQQAYKSVGYTRKELLSMNIADIDAEATENNKGGLFWPKILAGQSATFESTQKRKDGSVFCVEVTLGAIILDKETLIIGLVSDTTERKKTETALKESETRHRIISGLIEDVAFSYVKPEGENFAIDWISGAAEKVFGCSVEEIKRRGSWKFLVDPQDLPVFEDKIVGLSPGQSSTCELRIICVDGSKWIRVFARAEKDKTNPKTYRLFGACENITEQESRSYDLKAKHSSEGHQQILG